MILNKNNFTKNERDLEDLVNRLTSILIDPLAIELTKKVEWWKLTGLSNNKDEKYPVAVIGEGKPVLMLHGFDSCFLEFRRLAFILKNNYKLIIPDMFGFGFSPRPYPANYGKEAIILHLNKILMYLNTEEPIGLIGASMGGGIAMELARANPKAINRLLLLSPAGLTGKQKPLPPLIDQLGVWILSQPAIRKGLCNQAFAYPKQKVGKAEQQIASIHLPVPGWRRSLAAFAKQGGLANCGKPLPSQPIQVIWGAQDRILKGKVKEDTFKILGPYIEEIQNCGHLPHLDHPQIVAKKWESGLVKE